MFGKQSIALTGDPDRLQPAVGLAGAASYVLAKNISVFFATFHAIEAFGKTGEKRPACFAFERQKRVGGSDLRAK
jgi:hypothetical protein